MVIVVCAVCAYLIGSVNFGVILSKFIHNRDVRELGDKTAGSSNILHNFGFRTAFSAFFGDFMKGVITVLLARIVLADESNSSLGVLLASLLVVTGHIFPVFFRFRGGRGMAAAAGAVAALSPIAGLILLVIFTATLLIFRYISFASVITAASYPVVTFILQRFFENTDLVNADMLHSTIVAALIEALIVVAHRQSIRRLLDGEEHRIDIFGSDKSKTAEPDAQSAAPEASVPSADKQ